MNSSEFFRHTERRCVVPMMRLRMSPWLWGKVKDAERFRAEIEAYVNRELMWIWRQPARYRTADGAWKQGAVRPVMLASGGAMKLLLRPAAMDGYDYELVDIRRAHSKEHYEAVLGRSLRGEKFQVLRPNEKPPGQVGVIINKQYNELPEHLKVPIDLAWSRLVAGRRKEKVRVENSNIFLLTGDGGEEWIDELDGALSDAQVGRVATDPYEIKKIEELCEKYGQPRQT